uniref:IDP476 n=1 Tax=Arundo donax TaxID=35708 RepID=A0A0A9CA20_ARUDO
MLKRTHHLRHQSARGGRLVLPGGGDLLGAAVIAGEAVHPALGEDEPELGVHVLLVPVQVLPDRDGLLDKEVEVLGHLRREAADPEHAQDLAASNALDVRHAVQVAEERADLRRHLALLGGVHDRVLHLGRGGLDPARGGALVGQHRGGHPLPGAVHATHGGRQRGLRRPVRGGSQE